MLNNNTRMNSTIRKAMLDKVKITSGVTDEMAAIKADRATLAEKCRQHALLRDGLSDEYVATMIGEIDTLSKTLGDWYRVDVYSSNNYMHVNLSGLSVYLYHDGAISSEGSTRKSDKIWPRHRVDIVDESYRNLFEALEARDTAVEAKWETTQVTLNATLKRYKTVGSLLAAWPEAAELLPDSVESETGTGIAISVADLNAMCGVPAK